MLAFTGYQALHAKDSLEIVATEFENIASALKDGDEARAERSLAAAQDAAAQASDSTDDPTWWLTSKVPGVGDDVEAIRTVADVTHVLAQRVLPDVVVASDKLDPENLSPENGRIALEPLEVVAPAVVAADQEMQEQEDRVAAIDTAELNAQIAEPVELMQRKLGEAASLSSKASYAVRLLPPMLGADDKRSYLLLFQNNAEIRATGGIPGAWAIVNADDGKISLGRQGSSTDLGRLTEPLELTEEEVALYSNKMGAFPQDLNFTPDFPRTAELASEMWRQGLGTTVDGVASVDPVALSYLLEGTGPVSVPGGGQVTAENAVPLLLNDVYRMFPDPRRQDDFFALAAKAVFEKAVSGSGDAQEVLEGVSAAASEGRVYAWSSRKAEQELLAETVIGGAIPRVYGDAQPFVGVFLNDGTGAKMQYFLDHRVDVEPVACNSEGRQEIEVNVRLTSTAPREASELPPYVVGMAEQLGMEPGVMRVNTHLYAPSGGWIESSQIDGTDLPLSELPHLGRPVGSRTVQLSPGQTRTVTYTVMTGLDQTGDVHLRVTPGVRSSGVGEVGPTACNVS